MIATLVSDESRWVTGQNVEVSGGYNLWPGLVGRPCGRPVRGSRPGRRGRRSRGSGPLRSGTAPGLDRPAPPRPETTRPASCSRPAARETPPQRQAQASSLAKARANSSNASSIIPAVSVR
ncbi:hypothetical protein [Streptomyces zaehneri]|uniref:hypothetical protein n=1 Tax=Streptomyces zaehneri TaxID=3051180 RepID=UPI0028D6119E|nr:hypothetical protein [Streptomyces sp. DSM 40713]